MPVCLSVCLVVCVSMYIQGVHGGDLLAIPHVVSTSVGSCDVDIRPVSPALSECAHSTLLEPHCLRDQNFIYFSQYKLKDIQKQSQLENTIASPKIQRHQPKHKNNMDTTQNHVHVQRYDRVLTTEY